MLQPNHSFHRTCAKSRAASVTSTKIANDCFRCFPSFGGQHRDKKFTRYQDNTFLSLNSHDSHLLSKLAIPIEDRYLLEPKLHFCYINARRVEKSRIAIAHTRRSPFRPAIPEQETAMRILVCGCPRSPPWPSVSWLPSRYLTQPSSQWDGWNTGRSISRPVCPSASTSEGPDLHT